MSRPLTSKAILKMISPENQQPDLKQSQHDIDAQLAGIRTQLERQSESTFGDKTWIDASWPKFSARLITHGKALIELAERLQANTPRS
jgi:hypothetical protein